MGRSLGPQRSNLNGMGPVWSGETSCPGGRKKQAAKKRKRRKQAVPGRVFWLPRGRAEAQPD